MHYVPDVDSTNSNDWAYPGFPNCGRQGSNRFSGSLALRSTVTSKIVNEARFGFLGGVTLFEPDVNLGQFQTNGVGNQDGFVLSLSPISSAYRTYSPERRDVPNETFEDNVSWSKGAHTLSFGGTFTNVGNWVWDQNVVPTIGFGVNSSYDPAYVIFNSQNSPKNFPGASSSDISSAQSFYALMTGRVTSIGGNAVLSKITNKYSYNGAQVQRGHMREVGFYVSDSWRILPNLTINYGARWELQLPFVPLNNMYTWNTVADLWGLTGQVTNGFGNEVLYTPGQLPGVAPTYKLYKAGDHAHNISHHDVAPSFGLAWQPNASEGLLKHILGELGKSVFRGGFLMAYNRNGMYDYTSMFGANPGMTISATRNTTNGNLLDFGNVRVVGMTVDDLKNATKLRFDNANRQIY
jgi:hypothetical protein